MKEETDYYGADIAGSIGFATVWDCMGWCINTPKCQSVSFRATDGQCWVKSKATGDRIAAHNLRTSISLPCMQS